MQTLKLEVAIKDIKEFEQLLNLLVKYKEDLPQELVNEILVWVDKNDTDK